MAETIVQFPDESVGVLCRRNPASGEAEWFARAAGAVAIPDDAVLSVSAFRGPCLESLLPVARQIDALYVNQKPITGAELAPVAHFANLTHFDASKAWHLDDEGVRYLAGLSRLEHVDLYCTQVTDAGLPSLANLRNLNYLHLGGTRVRGSGLSALRGLPRLGRLSIEHMPVRDDALAMIDCPALSKLVAFGTRVTPNGVRAFQRRFPRCEIVVNMEEIAERAQRDAEVRELLTLLIQRVVPGHWLKAENGDRAVAAAADRLFPVGTRFESVGAVDRPAEVVQTAWDPDDLWYCKPARWLRMVPHGSQVRVTFPNGRRALVRWLAARGAERRRKPAAPRALAN